MDKTLLKKFAIESRRDLMQKIESKIQSFFIEDIFEKKQNGEIYTLSNEFHSLSLTNEDYQKRELLIKRINESSLSQVIEEASYTWFNRIIALRYMEINDILPLTRDNQSLGIRVLSSKENTPDPEILKFSNLMNPDLDIDFKKEKFIELKDDNEKFKYILLLICKKLSKVIPQVFDGVTDYIDILIPDNLLNDTGFITKIINEVPTDNYNQVEIIGWLYQYYISDKKDIVFSNLKKNIKITKNDIPSATQLFTPDWIVKYLVENSIGNYIKKQTSDLNSIIDKSKYFINENDNSTAVNKFNIEDIKIIDPCCGSGHMLVYAFEYLTKIYENYGYSKSSASKIILEKNIYGLDIDDRAGQLTVLSLILKARKYDKSLFSKQIKLNIYSVQESNSLNDNLFLDIKDTEVLDIIEYVKESFKDAKEYGSILKIEEKEYDRVIEEVAKISNIFAYSLKNELIPLIEQAKIMSRKYDVVITNPPYMGNRGMSSKLLKYASKYYPNSKSDFFSMFLNNEYVKENGYLGMITPTSWIFLSSFKNVRKEILNNYYISSMLHMGRGIFGVDFGSVAFVLNKNLENNCKGTYFKLYKRTFQYIDVEDIEEIFLNSKNDDNYEFDFDGYKRFGNINEDLGEDNEDSEEVCIETNRIKFYQNQKIFDFLPDSIIAYWISNKMLETFKTKKIISSVAELTNGMFTCNNKLFLRNWYEVNINNSRLIDDNSKWVPYNKGGNFRKWYGNQEYFVNYGKDGSIIRKYRVEAGQSESFPGERKYFLPSISWSAISSMGFGARMYPKGFVFDIAGSSLFALDEKYTYYILGLLNTKMASYYLNMMNPTMNFQIGNIGAIPFVDNEELLNQINNLVLENIDISKQDWNSYETSWDFSKHPLLTFANLSPQKIKIEESNGYQVCNNLEDAYNHWVICANERFEKVKNNEIKLNENFMNIYNLQSELNYDITDKDITIRKADKNREIKSLISYSVGCMFGRYSLDESGVAFAGGEFNENKYKTFNVDKDNIIPITDNAYFNDDIVFRFKQFIKTVFGTETLNENLDFIAETLGKRNLETSEDTIRRYFNDEFYNDHIKIYQKKPIYWQFDSGKKSGFKCLVYMHRYNNNLIPKVRLDYLHRMQNTYEKMINDVNERLKSELVLNDKKEQQKLLIELSNKLQETKEYDEKIAHLANQRIEIDFDDGITTNYEKLQDVLTKIK